MWNAICPAHLQGVSFVLIIDIETDTDGLSEEYFNDNFFLYSNQLVGFQVLMKNYNSFFM